MRWLALIVLFVMSFAIARSQYALMTLDPYTGSVAVTIDPIEANNNEKATVQRLMDLGFTEVEVSTKCAVEMGQMEETMTSSSSLSEEMGQFMYEVDPLRGVQSDKQGRVVKYAYTAVDEDENYIDAVASVEYGADGSMTLRGDQQADPFDYMCKVERDAKGRIIRIHEASERDVNPYMTFEFTYDDKGRAAVLTFTTEPSDVSNRVTRIERTFMDNGLIASEKVYGDCLSFICGAEMMSLTEDASADAYAAEPFLQEVRTYVYR